MKPSSAKQKGRVLQQMTRDLLLATCRDLTSRDVESTAMGQNGADVKLSQLAFSYYPLAIECKNVAIFQGYTYMEQAKAHAKKGGIPVVVVKENYQDPLVMLSLEDFNDLLLSATLALESNT